MENEKEIKELIQAFVEYRNLFTPIEQNLRSFADTYENMREDINALNNSFDGSIQDKLDRIYGDLSKQFEKSKDLSARIEAFRQKTDGFAAQMENLIDMFSKIENRIGKIDEIESKATGQIEKLNAIIEQKKKVYDVKELEKNLEAYNSNVQKINDYINKDIAETLKDNNAKINTIKDKNESVYETLAEEKSSINKLIESYSQTNKLLKNIVEKQDVNEQYIFDILDKWAKDRGVKTKKWGEDDANGGNQSI